MADPKPNAARWPAKGRKKTGRPSHIHTVTNDQHTQFLSVLRMGVYLQFAVRTLGIGKTTWDEWRERASKGQEPYRELVLEAEKQLELAQVDKAVLLHKHCMGTPPQHADFRALEFWFTHGPGKKHWFMRTQIDLMVDEAREQGVKALLDVAKDFFSDAGERARFYDAVARRLSEEGSDRAPEGDRP